MRISIGKEPQKKAPRVTPSDLINSPQRAQSSQRFFIHTVDPCISVQSVFHHISHLFSLPFNAYVNCVSAFICVHLRLNRDSGGV